MSRPIFSDFSFRSPGRFPSGLNAVAAACALGLLAGCATGPGPSSGRPDAANPHAKLGNPYVIDGRRYVPREDPDYDETGVASWYGDQFHGRHTANGEIFDMWNVTAAHKTLPLPSLVEVENLDNRKRITVRVNDRGPFAHNRIIDLSRAAARELGFEQAGLAKVRVRYVGPASLDDAIVSLGQPKRHADARRQSSPPASPKSPAPPRAIAAAPDNAADERETADILAVMAAARDASPQAVAPVHYVVDVNAVRDLTRALNQLDFIGDLNIASRQAASGEVFYDLRLGPYALKTEAEQALEAVRASGYADAEIGAIDAAVF